MTFQQFAGNRNLLETLQQMIAAERLPHAILLEGEEGLGKFTLASLIAKAAVCRGENAPCEKCGDCHLADIGNHPDISVIEPDGKLIKVDAVREVIRAAFVKPSQAKRKVFIFRGAEKMNEAGQNALLKTLEEPPQSVIFILLAESSASLLPTVISRCTSFSLSAPAFSEGVKRLVELGLEKDAAEERLTAAMGNIGKALALNKTKADKVSAEEFLQKIAEKDSYSALLLLKKLEKDRNGALIFFQKLQTLILNERRSVALGRSTLRFSGEYLIFAEEVVRKALEQTNINGNLSLVFHTLCYKLK